MTLLCSPCPCQCHTCSPWCWIWVTVCSWPVTVDGFLGIRLSCRRKRRSLVYILVYNVLLAVTVKVDKVLDRVLLVKLLQIFFNSVRFRGELLDQKLTPLPIQIQPRQITPWRPMHNPIRIYHRHNKNDILFQQHLNHWHTTQHFINHSLTHKRTYRLTRMLSCRHQDGLLVLWGLLVYFQSGDDIVGQGMTQFL